MSFVLEAKSHFTRPSYKMKKFYYHYFFFLYLTSSLIEFYIRFIFRAVGNFFWFIFIPTDGSCLFFSRSSYVLRGLIRMRVIFSCCEKKIKKYWEREKEKEKWEEHYFCAACNLSVSRFMMPDWRSYRYVGNIMSLFTELLVKKHRFIQLMLALLSRC